MNLCHGERRGGGEEGREKSEGELWRKGEVWKGKWKSGKCNGQGEVGVEGKLRIEEKEKKK